MQAQGQKPVPAVPSCCVVTANSVPRTWDTLFVNLFVNVYYCVQQLAWVAFFSLLHQLLVMFQLTWSGENFANLLVLGDEHEQVPCSLCVGPRPVWTVACTPRSAFVITFREGGKWAPNCHAVRSLLAIQLAGLDVRYYCEGQVYDQRVPDSLSPHLIPVKGSPDGLCLQLLLKFLHL